MTQIVSVFSVLWYFRACYTKTCAGFDSEQGTEYRDKTTNADWSLSKHISDLPSTHNHNDSVMENRLSKHLFNVVLFRWTQHLSKEMFKEKQVRADSAQRPNTNPIT